MKMKRDISKNGQGQKTLILLKTEMNTDFRMLQNNNLTCCNTHIGFGTNHLDEYNAEIKNNKNIV